MVERLGDFEMKQFYISFQNVFAWYSKDSPQILKNISFRIEQGEKIGIIGRTGAGKSSLVKIILRFMDDIEGSIELNGFDTLNNDIWLIRR